MHEIETFITMAKEDIKNQKFTLQNERKRSNLYDMERCGRSCVGRPGRRI